MPRYKTKPASANSSDEVRDQKEKKEETTVPVPALLFSIDRSISSEHVRIVKSLVKRSSNEQLYLIIKSYGGDAYSAVRIMKYLRTIYSNIIGVIPNYAYSAATLMLLGTNKFLVAADGNIGPIDKPLEHESGESISALDMTNSITTLASLVSSQALTFYGKLRGPRAIIPDSISKRDALETAWKSAVELICPLVEKIDPVLLQKAYRDLKIGIYYGIDLLTDGMIKDYKQASDVVNNLVSMYPSHSFAIFREDMKALGLKVENLEESPDLQQLLNMYNKNEGIKFMEDIYVK